MRNLRHLEVNCFKMGIKVRPPLFQACSLYHILWAIVNSSQGENLPPLLPMKDEGDRPHHPGQSTSARDCFELRHLKTHKYSKETGRKTALRKLYWFPKSERNIWKREGEPGPAGSGRDLVRVAALSSPFFSVLVTARTLFLFVWSSTSTLGLPPVLVLPFCGGSREQRVSPCFSL